MTDESLLVLLFGEVVGELRRAGRYSEPTFRYARSYLDSGATVPLSTRLPLRADRYPAKNTMPYIEGLLPENPDVRNRWASSYGLSRADAFGLLSGMGWDCPGAVQFTTADTLAELQYRSGEESEYTQQQIGARLRGLRSAPASWNTTGEHWSLAGQQSKFALRHRGGRWFEAKGSSATTHIVKPGIGTMRYQALVEHATMKAASLVGVNMAKAST